MGVKAGMSDSAHVFRTSETSLPPLSELRKRCPAAITVVERLREAGYLAYFAGGCVRDMWLGRGFKDVDIASNAPPERVEALFARTHAIGKSFGVIQVVVDDVPFEVAAFRQDRAYHDGRHPEGYAPTTPEEDAARRDFTINGLFFDPLESRVLDFVGGREDLRRGVVRAIGDADERFREDHLRLLRAARFAAVLDFDLEPETFAAIRKHAGLLDKVSVERIRDEFTRILVEAPRAGAAVELLDACGLLERILPEFLDLKGCEQPPEFHPEGDVWTHTVMMLNRMERPSPKLALAVLLHDIGKPATRAVEEGRIRFAGHARVGAEMAERWMERMKYPKALRRSVAGMVDRHMNFMNVSAMRNATRRRMAAHPDFRGELAMHRLDCACSNGLTAGAELMETEREAFEREAALPEPWISGRDVLALGVEPGPEVGRWKRLAYEEQLEGRVETPDALREWLRERVRGGQENRGEVDGP